MQRSEAPACEGALQAFVVMATDQASWTLNTGTWSTVIDKRRWCPEEAWVQERNTESPLCSLLCIWWSDTKAEVHFSSSREKHPGAALLTVLELAKTTTVTHKPLVPRPSLYRKSGQAAVSSLRSKGGFKRPVCELSRPWSTFLRRSHIPYRRPHSGS